MYTAVENKFICLLYNIHENCQKACFACYYFISDNTKFNSLIDSLRLGYLE